MPIRLRNGHFHVDVSVGGRRVQRSALTADRKEAQRIHDEIRAELWRVQVAGELPRVSFAQAAAAYLEDRDGRLSDLETTRDRLRWIVGRIGKLQVSEVTQAIIADTLAARRREGVTRNIKLRSGQVRKVRVSDTVSPATLDRYAAAIGVVLTHARDRGWLRNVPKIPKQSGRRAATPVFATREQAAALLEALPPHLRAMAAFALATGLRRANITGLRWEQVNLPARKAWIEAQRAKGKKAIGVPLNDSAVAILRAQLGQHPTIVFPYRGDQVTRVTGIAWRKAVKAAGLPDGFRFHALRHTWASWHAMNGTPPQVLKELGAWSSLEMVLVYSHLSPEHVAGWAGNAEGPTREESVTGQESHYRRSAENA